MQRIPDLRIAAPAIRISLLHCLGRPEVDPIVDIQGSRIGKLPADRKMMLDLTAGATRRAEEDDRKPELATE